MSCSHAVSSFWGERSSRFHCIVAANLPGIELALWPQFSSPSPPHRRVICLCFPCSPVIRIWHGIVELLHWKPGMTGTACANILPVRRADYRSARSMLPLLCRQRPQSGQHWSTLCALTCRRFPFLWLRCQSRRYCQQSTRTHINCPKWPLFHCSQLMFNVECISLYFHTLCATHIHTYTHSNWTAGLGHWSTSIQFAYSWKHAVVWFELYDLTNRVRDKVRAKSVYISYGNNPHMRTPMGCCYVIDLKFFVISRWREPSFRSRRMTHVDYDLDKSMPRCCLCVLREYESDCETSLTEGDEVLVQSVIDVPSWNRRHLLPSLWRFKVSLLVVSNFLRSSSFSTSVSLAFSPLILSLLLSSCCPLSLSLL